LLCAAYGWTPDVIAGFTPDQVEYFLHHLPLIEARRHYPLAQLEATILNMMGGKGDVDEHGREKKPEKPPKPAHLLWTPQERLAFYASFGEAAKVTPGMSRETAQDIIDNLSEAPAWALHLVPLDEAKRVLSP